MEKGLIEKIGTIEEDGVIAGWVISGGDYPGVDYTQDPPLCCGYTVEELKQIVRVKEVISGQITIDEPITLTIPEGCYLFGVFGGK